VLCVISPGAGCWYHVHRQASSLGTPGNKQPHAAAAAADDSIISHQAGRQCCNAVMPDNSCLKPARVGGFGCQGEATEERPKTATVTRPSAEWPALYPAPPLPPIAPQIFPPGFATLGPKPASASYQRPGSQPGTPVLSMHARRHGLCATLPYSIEARTRCVHVVPARPSNLHCRRLKAVAMDFSHFSFDAASSRAPEYDAELAAMTVSPTSTRLPPLPARLPTPPPCSMGDLAQILDQQSLRIAIVPVQKSANEPLTPPGDDVTFATALPERRPHLSLSTSRINSATLRMQRQANVRLQSSSSHIKDISLLVEKMIEAEDQCNVCEHKPSLPPSPTSDDEGISMEYTVPNPTAALRTLLPFYRAGDRVDGCTRVSKNARMRRRPRLTARLSK
jgi:hypothetical protein